MSTENFKFILFSFVRYAPLNSSIRVEVRDALGALTGLSLGVKLGDGMYHRQGAELKCEVRLSVVHTTW